MEALPQSVPAGSMRRDLASAYFAAAARVGSWVVVSALVYRFLGPADFAMLALVRGTLGILNYVTLGLAPAIINRAPAAAIPIPALPVSDGTDGDRVLPYFGAAVPAPLSSLYGSALAIAAVGAVFGLIVTVAYALWFDDLYQVPVNLLYEMPSVVVLMGVGLLLRLIGDVPGSILQAKDRISLDNAWVAAGDLAWVVLTPLSIDHGNALSKVAFWYALSGGLSATGRLGAVIKVAAIGPSALRTARWHIVKPLLAFGAMVVAAQLADYLYAPTDYILINRLLFFRDMANYAPAVQIDAGLLLLVSGLSGVLLPKAALAHAAGSARTVRTYYVRGTLASLGLLAVAALLVWLASPWLFRLWLGNPMPQTQAILPLVLTHTILGGSSAVGRSILLATGRVRPFTASVLIAGAVNVACSYAFVRYLNLGLKGIVLGTIVAVVGRCVFWMPGYVLWTLRNPHPSRSLQNRPD